MSKDAAIRIVVTGGGTGGHVEPVIAVVKALAIIAPKAEILWIGEKNSREQAAAAALGVGYQRVAVGKFRRYNNWRNLSDPLKVGIGYFQALITLMRFKPEVVFSKAGYVAVPTLLASSTLSFPIVAHESDTAVGLANRLALTRAKFFCTGFPLRFYPKTIRLTGVYTGNPIRQFPRFPTKLDAALVLSASPDAPTLVILGGSQGALPINQWVWRSLPQLLAAAQVIHQTGGSHVAAAEETRSKLPKNLQSRYIISGYFETRHLAAAYTLAWCALSRAGANTIADLSHFGIPTVFVPLPNSAGNHQVLNAVYVEDQGAATVIDQTQMDSGRLMSTLSELLLDERKRRIMGKAMTTVNSPQAADAIARKILQAASFTKQTFDAGKRGTVR